MDLDELLKSIRNFDPSILDYEGKFPKVDGDWGYLRRMAMRDMLPHIVTSRDNTIEANPAGPFRVQADNRLVVGYRTGSGNEMTMALDLFQLSRDMVPVMTPYETFASCRECRGSSGGCPGFAPWFPTMYRNHDFIYVLAVHFDMRWAKRYAAGGKSARLFQNSYADLLTEKYTRRLLAYVSGVLGHKRMLGMGNCSGCHPQYCTVIRGEPCNHPHRRTFSCEAVGVDCDMLHCQLYGEWLPWTYYAMGGVQSYMSRYAMQFAAKELDYAALLYDAACADPSHVPVGDVEGGELIFDASDVYTVEVPSGVHAGYTQYVRDP